MIQNYDIDKEVLLINKERLVHSFLDYVQISSPTRFEKTFAQHMMSELKSLGLEVYMDNAGEKVGSNAGNVIAKLKSNTEGIPVILSAHMDTVSPSENIKPVIKDDIIYSDGTTVLGGDDKAGIAAIMEALRTVIENDLPHPTLEIVFSIFEEGGLHGAKNLDYNQLESKRAFVFDSSTDPGDIIVKGPAQDKIHVKLTGKASHAGVAPEKGISAIMIASRAIDQMKLLRISEATTANIGKISGGSATNIVMPELIIEAEARSLDHDELTVQSEHMKHCFVKAAEDFGGHAQVEIKRMYNAFNLDASSDIVKSAQAIVKATGLTPRCISTGGGSDTNVYNANGIQSVNFGIGEKMAHTLNEHMSIKDLVKASEIALKVISHHVTQS